MVEPQDSPADHPQLQRPARPDKPRASSPASDGELSETAYASLDELVQALLAEPKLRHLVERLTGRR